MKWLVVLAIVLLAACEGVTIVQPPGIADTVVVQDTLRLSDTVTVVVVPPPADEPEDEEEEDAGEDEDGEEEAKKKDDGRRGKCGLVGGPSPCRRGKGKGNSG